MKKVLKSLVTILLAFTISTSVFAANDNISVYVNNEKVSFDVQPQTINGRTMVPMRAIFEKLGAEVFFFSDEQAIVAVKENLGLVIYLNQEIGGLYDANTDEVIKIIKFDTPATVVNGRTLVPIRTISDSFGYDVKWDNQTKRISIVSPDASKPDDIFAGYTKIDVYGGNLSGIRKANVVVDVGYGDREYWAFTNEYGQLVRVVADEIIPQNDYTEPVNSNGRYYDDEAKVPGVERSDLDEGHVIADSLGGVSNAYNITPQNSTLNRYGDQAYMEKAILSAGGATNFEAIITYPNTKTQIPSHYKYTYTLKGNVIVDSFDNVDPDKINANLGITNTPISTKPTTTTTIVSDDNQKGEMVWIPKSGSKYHSRSSCSNMKNPAEVSISYALSKGYTACKKCF